MAGDLVLVTGSTGLVGFAALRAALKHGYKIRAAVRSEQKAETVRSNPTLKDISEDQLSFVVVPDFLKDGAFDDAVKDVKYILHVASPIPSPDIKGEDDLDALLVQPAIQATASVFKSARKAGTVQRIVVTSSAAALVPMSAMMGKGLDQVFGPDSRGEALPSPYMNNTQAAYGASKIHALKYAEDYIASEKPGFDTIHIHPTVVLGRDELALTSKDLDKGSNHFVLGLLLGEDNPVPFPVAVTHIDDVALAHVLSLDPEIAGNQSFMLSCYGNEGYSWEDAKGYAKERFPQAVGKGWLPCSGNLSGFVVKSDPSKTETQLGIKAKSFESMLVDLIGQYVELKEKEQGQ